MAGRPAKSSNPDLTRRIEEYRAQGDLSYTEVSTFLGVHCSTLTRSVRDHLYSRELERRAVRLMATGKTRQSALLLLREFARNLPEIERALREVLDSQEAGE